ncbi:MFS transporter [Amycolatopsis alkalitolerans]|uniref:MFS transporter n=1 Tax=Amycolatopsis alkalitolerans TaxID=2547244 RepID=A0A5C4LQR0_9PSEU|nr:MFS transporter [Amycolatopsis alkalitolerans]TNC20978.1 MFS transporter [Amycolatopsis alkalitolerans]
MASSEVESYTPGTNPEDTPHPRRRLIFAIVSMALFMAAVDQTIVATALPAIQRELAAPVNWSGWTITIYALGQVLMMPVAGRISDQFGRKKVFMIAAVLFTASSLACGFAGDIYLLVVLRAIQAIGGGAFMPSATGIVADHFGHDRDRALGMFTSIFPIGGIVGPIAGGAFVAFWSWRGIFLVNVPIGLVLIALAAKFLPASEPREAGRVDFPGVALLGVLVFTSMFGITYLGSGSTSLLSPVFLVSEAIAVIAVVAFIRHAKYHPEPFIPFELMRGRGFGVMNLINLCYGAAALGFGALVPLYAEDRFHIRSLEAGTLLTARAVGTICVAALAVLALRRTGHRLPMLVGFLISAGGLAAMYAAPNGFSPYLWLTIAAGVSGVGMGMTVPASNNASLQLAPDKVAAIAGLRGMFRQGGAIISISVTTAVIARSSDAGMAQAYTLLVFAALMVAVLPLLVLVPDHRGAW